MSKDSDQTARMRSDLTLRWSRFSYWRYCHALAQFISRDNASDRGVKTELPLLEQ